jgi:aldehyde dehydrogenase (NAD+)
METAQRKAPALHDGFDKMLIHGTRRHGRGARTVDDVDLYTNDAPVRIPLANEEDMDEAYRAAAVAHRAWAGTRPGQRSAVLGRAAEKLETRRDEIEGTRRRSSSTSDRGIHDGALDLGPACTASLSILNREVQDDVRARGRR